MLAHLESFDEQLHLLFRALRSELFRFIVIQQNHPKVLKEVEQTLLRQFPTRTIVRLNIEGMDLSEFVKSLSEKNGGIYLLENFEHLLHNPDFARGFNQRRDQYTKRRFQFVTFLPNESRYLVEATRLIPDVWSLRNLVLQLTATISLDERIVPAKLKSPSSLGGKTQKEKEKELNRILERIRSTPLDTTMLPLLRQFYEQAIILAEDVDNHPLALALTDQWLTLAPKDKKGGFLKKIVLWLTSEYSMQSHALIQLGLLGERLYQEGKMQEAADILRRLLQYGRILAKSNPPQLDTPDGIVLLNNLGDAIALLAEISETSIEDLKEGEVWLRRAMQLAPKNYAENRLVYIKDSLGLILYHRGRLEGNADLLAQAVSLLSEASDTFKKYKIDHHAENAKNWAAIALTKLEELRPP